MGGKRGTSAERARYLGLRETVLSFTPAKLKLEPEVFANGRAFGVMMDFKIGEDDASVFCSHEPGGRVHAALYTSGSFGVIGENFGEATNDAARDFIDLTQDHLPKMSKAMSLIPADPGRVRFYAMTEQGILTMDAESTVDQPGPLRELENAGHVVILRMREVVEARREARRRVN